MPRHFGLPWPPARPRSGRLAAACDLLLKAVLCLAIASCWLAGGLWVFQRAVDRAEFISVLPTERK
ncbi:MULTISPECIES: hypothetical protein [unclassified Bradyrhizobium]|uniref:hypothetical protein n=1 Tax=unclassified Bradyrhizobium TaxID=2631580 RepID=UPI0028ED9258|nr:MULTISPECIES: hypothetical protein [unclassified Bradyrhizobium]